MSDAQTPAAGEITLSVEAAFLAATDLLWQYVELGTGSLNDLLADASVFSDNRLSDPAVWAMWEEAVARIANGLPPRGRWLPTSRLPDA